MLNYIKSELYRNLKNRNLKIAVAVCFVLIVALVFILANFLHTEVGFVYGNTRFALSNVYLQMGTMLILTCMFSLYLHDNEEKYHTIKHSVSFGVSRNTIYFGRVIAQVISCIVIYVVLCAVLCILSFIMLEHSNAGEVQALIIGSLVDLPCLIAAIAITHFFLMSIESQNAAFMYSISIVWILPLILDLLARKIVALRTIIDFLPFNAVSYDGPMFENSNMFLGAAETIAIGAVWAIAFLVLGMIRFSKKEIK